MISLLLRYLGIFLAAVTAAFLAGCGRSLALVETNVMAPTIVKESMLIIEKRRGALQRGDVVAFRMPTDQESTSVMRVYAIAGDTVRYDMKSGLLMIADDAGRQVSRVQVSMDPGYKLKPEAVLKTGELFVMGDNMSDSYDSRYWGLLHEGRVLGVVPVSVMASESDARWRALATGERAGTR